MKALRVKKIGAHLIEEFYYGGEPAVYVDNKLTDLSFQEACIRYEAMERRDAK